MPLEQIEWSLLAERREFEAAPTVRGALENALKAIAEKHEERLRRERELAEDA